MDDRRAMLDMTWEEVADAAGLTREGLRRLRQGKGSSIRSQSKAGIERALRWEHGSVQSILEGGDPIASADEPSTEELADDLLHRMDELEELINNRLGKRSVRDSLFKALRASVEESTTEH